MQEMTPEQQLNRETFANINDKIIDVSAQLSAISAVIESLIETHPNAKILLDSIDRKCQILESSLSSSDSPESVGRKLLARISSMKEVAQRASSRQA